MFSRVTHLCQGCREKIRRPEQAMATYQMKWAMRKRFHFHMKCGLEWLAKGAPILPGAMTEAAIIAGVLPVEEGDAK